jgi:hypothetical protein
LPSDYCNAAGACVARKSQGAACDQTAGADCRSSGCRDCASGYCVDGFCCDTACNGVCLACAAALQQTTTDGGAPKDGTCGFAKDDTNPHNDACPVDAPASCLHDGKCDGAGGCRLYYPPGASCGPSACQSGNKAAGALCNGNGFCVPNPSGIACDPYLCKSGTCPNSCAQSSDCAAGFYCKQSACVPLQANGAKCGAGSQCTSGFCVDGFCCNTPCTVQCAACDVASAEGTCAPVIGAPHGSRAACAAPASSDRCEASRCNGIDPTSCSGKAGSETECRAASCADGIATLRATCNGSGKCPDATTIACGAYACDDATAQCKSSCASDADCAVHNTCASGRCIAGATCRDDHTSVPADKSAPQDCTPYKCDTTGLCKVHCASVEECAAPNVCDANGHCVAFQSNGGGGCVLARGARSHVAWAMLAIAAGLLLRVRRRR